MATTRLLTNRDKKVEKKANYFAEYFIWYARHLGQLYETEFENPISLVRKIIFQLKTNHKPQSVNYINNHLDHPYFKKGTFLQHFSLFKHLRKQIHKYNAVTGKNKQKDQHQFLQSHPGFIQDFEAFEKQLSTEMVPHVLKTIISYLKCPHELIKHKKSIEFLTKILVTQFYFTGRQSSDILKIFDRILKKQLKDFPFPPVVQTVDEKKAYLAGMNLDKQFMAMGHFFDEIPEDVFVLIRAKGVTFEKVDTFKYDKINFFHPRHSKFKKIRQQLSKRNNPNMYRQFFKGPDFIIAVVPARIFSDSPNIPEIVAVLKKELTFLGLMLEHTFSIDTKSYFFTADFIQFGGRANYSDGIRSIGKSELSQLNNNGYNVLSGYSGPAIDYFLQNEYTLINAGEIENIEGYWRYLENLFSPKQSMDIIEEVSLLLLLEEKQTRHYTFVQHLVNTLLISFDYAGYGLSTEEFVALRKQLANKHQTKALYQKLKDPYFDNIRKAHYAHYSTKRYNLLKNYYGRLLLELYEVRNSIIHANLVEEVSVIKLKKIIPQLIRQMRYALFTYMKANPSKKFTDVLNLALQDARKLV